MVRTNRQILLAKRPHGLVSDDCYEHVEREVPELEEGQALVRTLCLSLDPTIRGWMNDMDSYMPPIAIGEPVRAGGVGEVVESRARGLAVGDRVFGLLGWQDYNVIAAGTVQPVAEGVSSEDALGVFGTTGMTAYFGMLDLGKPAAGETVLVSGAAGATGSVAGQIARLQGARVVGIAGGPEKCRHVVEALRFDACIDYRENRVAEGIAEHCPDGVDVYFDNVGGPILEAALDHIRERARVVLCGAISAYNLEDPPPGPRNLMNLVIRRGRMEGFIVLDYLPRFPEAIEALGRWVQAGEIVHRNDVVDGLENVTDAFQRLFTGGNTGKLLVRVAAREHG